MKKWHFKQIVNEQAVVAFANERNLQPGELIIIDKHESLWVSIMYYSEKP